MRAYRGIYAKKIKVIEEGIFGINSHLFNQIGATLRITNWRAGYQSLRRRRDYNEPLCLCHNFWHNCKNY